MRTTYTPLSVSAETDVLSFILPHAFQQQYSIALWRLPDENDKHLVISRNFQLLKTDPALEELPPGFIFAPFNPTQDRVFLPADYKFTFRNGMLLAPQHQQEVVSHTWLQEIAKQEQPTPKIKPYSKTHIPETKDKAAFLSFVKSGITAIEQGTVEKIVPSRSRRVDLSGTFDPVQAFVELCQAFPHALVSFVSTPETGSWIGATPELLVSVSDKGIFKTVALAGTQPYHEEIDLKAVTWTQKEIEEQALVERYVISCFKRIRLREYEEHGPKTVVAGNLIHLKTDFTVDMKETNFPQLGSVMLQLLHPTSAVCGMPLEPALAFLKKQEGYDRTYYSGFLGPVNIDNHINIFVNLRCMQLMDEQAILYAGAGVTEDSVPEKEWEETEIKMNTLLSIIKS